MLIFWFQPLQCASGAKSKTRHVRGSLDLTCQDVRTRRWEIHRRYGAGYAGPGPDALALTVSNLGQLDWGPVIGGYVGALLLASAYMAIGLCISARTDNGVALMITLVVGGLLYLVGAKAVASFFGNETSEFLRAIGTGSRFGIERGVLDVRDFLYYGSLTVFSSS